MGISVPRPPMTSPEPLPAPLERPITLTVPGVEHQHQFNDPANTAGKGTPVRAPRKQVPTPRPVPRPVTSDTAPSDQPAPPIFAIIFPGAASGQTKEDHPLVQPASEEHPRSESKPVPRSTKHYRRRVAQEDEAGVERKRNRYAKRTKMTTCGQCKKPRDSESHTQYYGCWYCANSAKESFEEWLARMVAKRKAMKQERKK